MKVPREAYVKLPAFDLDEVNAAACSGVDPCSPDGVVGNRAEDEAPADALLDDIDATLQVVRYVTSSSHYQ
jgi:hypothetical protein